MTSLRVESLACATALAALSLSACLAPTVAPAAEIIAVATGPPLPPSPLPLSPSAQPSAVRLNFVPMTMMPMMHPQLCPDLPTPPCVRACQPHACLW